MLKNLNLKSLFSIISYIIIFFNYKLYHSNKALIIEIGIVNMNNIYCNFSYKKLAI